MRGQLKRGEVSIDGECVKKKAPSDQEPNNLTPITASKSQVKKS